MIPIQLGKHLTGGHFHWGSLQQPDHCLNSLCSTGNCITIIFLCIYCAVPRSAVCMRVPHLADTFVVKETQSVTKDSGVVPVMSSHWAGDVPPVWNRIKKMRSVPLQCCSFRKPSFHLPSSSSSLYPPRALDIKEALTCSEPHRLCCYIYSAE